MKQTGRISISPELHLGSNELSAMSGLERAARSVINGINTSKFGIIRNRAVDPNFDNFKVSSPSAGTVRIPGGSVAVDINGDIINSRDGIDIAIPEGTTKYISVKYGISSVEDGTVSISNEGVISGSGTLFTLRLRGQRRLPVKIRFVNSSLNTDEYLVSEITSNTSAILVGAEFVAEAGLRYEVVGTFTPSEDVPEVSKLPYRYDFCEVVLNDTIPSLGGEEFVVARVTNTSGTIAIEDMRNVPGVSDYQIIPAYSKEDLLGIESVRFGSPTSAKSTSVIRVGVGVKVNGYTLNNNSRQITITSIVPTGRIRSISDIGSGMLDGCRVYRSDGLYDIVVSSVQTGGSVVLTMDTMNPDKYDGSTISVTVDSDFVSLSVEVQGSGYNNHVVFYTKDNSRDVNVEIKPGGSAVALEASFMISSGDATEYFKPAPDATGYLSESSFYPDGTIKPIGERTYVPYDPVSDTYYILTNEPSDSYRMAMMRMDKGDSQIYSETNVSTISGGDIIEYEVGVSSQINRFVGSKSFSENIYIKLMNPLVNLNEFIFEFDLDIVSFSSDKTIKIIDFDDVEIYSLTSFDLSHAMSSASSFIIRAWSYDEAWNVEVKQNAHGGIIGYKIQSITGSVANGHEWEINEDTSEVVFGTESDNVVITASSNTVPTRIVLPSVSRAVGSKKVIKCYGFEATTPGGRYISLGYYIGSSWTEILFDKTLNTGGGDNVTLGIINNYPLGKYRSVSVYRSPEGTAIPLTPDWESFVPATIVLQCTDSGWSAVSVQTSHSVNRATDNPQITGASLVQNYRRSLVRSGSSGGQDNYFLDKSPLTQNMMFTGGWTEVIKNVDETDLEFTAYLYYRVDRAGYLEMIGRVVFAQMSTGVSVDILTGVVPSRILASIVSPDTMFPEATVTGGTLAYCFIKQGENSIRQAAFINTPTRFHFRADQHIINDGLVLGDGDVIHLLNWRFPFSNHVNNYDWSDL